MKPRCIFTPFNSIPTAVLTLSPPTSGSPALSTRSCRLIIIHVQSDCLLNIAVYDVLSPSHRKSTFNIFLVSQPEHGPPSLSPLFLLYVQFSAGVDAINGMETFVRAPSFMPQMSGCSSLYA